MRSLILCACAGLLCLSPRAYGAQPVPVGSTLGEARLDSLNGGPDRLSAYLGRPLLINVWASWCGPCRAEVASLERLAWRDEAKHFSIIGVSTDDERDRALAWLKTSNATISQYLDHDLRLEHLLGASRIPLTLLVDGRGVVLERIYGAREWDSPESLEQIRHAFGINVSGKRKP